MSNCGLRRPESLFLGDDEGVDFDWLARSATEITLAGVQSQDRLSDIKTLRDFAEVT